MIENLSDRDNDDTDDAEYWEEPRQASMLLVTLHKPVLLPISFMDAIQQGGIKRISAFDEPVK